MQQDRTIVLAELALITIVAEAKAVLFYSRINAMVSVLHFHIMKLVEESRESWIMTESIDYGRKIPSVCYWFKHEVRECSRFLDREHQDFAKRSQIAMAATFQSPRRFS